MAETAARQVLFAVGRGGNPERHRPLLDELAAHGCSVVAPHFEWLASPTPSRDELLLRVRRVQLALDAIAPGVPTIGIGHSIGATTLLVLAGAGAGHFSFMHEPPPQTAEPLPDRDAFLARLGAELRGFIAR